MSKKRILMNNRKEKTFSDVWGEFITSQTAKGVSNITLRNYKQHLHSISKYLDIDTPIAELSKNDLDSMVVKMRKTDMAHNTIATYVRRDAVRKRAAAGNRKIQSAAGRPEDKYPRFPPYLRPQVSCRLRRRCFHLAAAYGA